MSASTSLTPQEGYGVMVLNTNRNREVVGDKKVPIRVSTEVVSLSGKK